MKKIIIFNHKMSLLYDDLYNYIERTNNLETDNVNWSSKFEL